VRPSRKRHWLSHKPLGPRRCHSSTVSVCWRGLSGPRRYASVAASRTPVTQNWSAQSTKSATNVVVLGHTDTKDATPATPPPMKMRSVSLITTTLTMTCTGRMIRNTTTRQSHGDFVPEGGIVLQQCAYIFICPFLFITCTITVGHMTDVSSFRT
jgi:hypothetical protein